MRGELRVRVRVRVRVRTIGDAVRARLLDDALDDLVEGRVEELAHEKDGHAEVALEGAQGGEAHAHEHGGQLREGHHKRKEVALLELYTRDRPRLQRHPDPK